MPKRYLLLVEDREGFTKFKEYGDWNVLSDKYGSQRPNWMPGTEMIMVRDDNGYYSALNYRDFRECIINE